MTVEQYVEEIKTIKYFSQHEPALAEWRVFTGPTWDSARDSAWASAWDAALECCLCCVCADLQLDDTHRAHAKARMDVWRRGWALLGDVNGVLYVYGVTPPGGTQ